ncbi:conserved hypothetical protein [gamma proteobacterium HTCC5015]|nr:conserved hypothetical protein [gamma proteobacterium HTCC5015]
MNIRHYLTCLLALLIALQSVAAMADVHQLHQSGTEHLEFDHSHQSTATDTHNDNLLAKQTPDQPGQSVYDCHHCCHCDGHGSVVLIGATSHLADLFSENGQADYQANLTSGIPPSLFRPPIA